MALRQIVKDACPEVALRAYRHIRYHLSYAKLAAPVVQIYINDGSIHSVAGFNNFLSFLSADAKVTGKLSLTLRDEDGKLIFAQTDRLDHFQNRFIDIRTVLEQQGLKSRMGLISLQFVPDHLRKDAYKKLGTLASHFFMFYRGDQGAMAMVHPSSTLDPSSPPSGPFVTNQIVDTQGLEAVNLYQCNPSQVAHELTIGLQDAETKRVICSETLTLAPCSVRKVTFEAGKAYKVGSGPMRVFTSSLPTSNSKPMLCRSYSGGRFSMSHS